MLTAMTIGTPQRMASQVVRVFPRGDRGSAQNLWRSTVACYVQGAYGKKGPSHGLPRDLGALLGVALDRFRRSMGLPEFVPAARA
jgi:hypothetical protein